MLLGLITQEKFDVKKSNKLQNSSMILRFVLAFFE